MADSTTILDLIAQSQSSKEITANALFDVASPAMFGGRRASACSGLTWGYYGGQIIAGTGVRVTVPNGTITLTASATNTIYLNRSGQRRLYSDCQNIWWNRRGGGPGETLHLISRWHERCPYHGRCVKTMINLNTIKADV
jgi:hypothetical protein